MVTVIIFWLITYSACDVCECKSESTCVVFVAVQTPVALTRNATRVALILRN